MSKLDLNKLTILLPISPISLSLIVSTNTGKFSDELVKLILSIR